MLSNTAHEHDEGPNPLALPPTSGGGGGGVGGGDTFQSLKRRWYSLCGRGGYLQQPRVQLAMGYGWAAGSISLLNNIWVTYNYPFFIGGPLASGSWFVVVQMLFLVWNSINDPIFGWLSDASVKSTPRHVLLLRCAPFFAVSFVMAWFPWSQHNDWIAALHFLFSLSFYDGALTFLEVNYSALLADVTTDNRFVLSLYVGVKRSLLP